MAERYRLGRHHRSAPWRDALAIEDYVECPPLTEPSVIAWSTRGGDHEKRARKIVDALNHLTWRPIETAPRDGSYVLLAGPSGFDQPRLRVHVGQWSMVQNDARKRWIIHNSNDFTDDGEPPTLWMPLP